MTLESSETSYDYEKILNHDGRIELRPQAEVEFFGA
jgi:hypothetical protein